MSHGITVFGDSGHHFSSVHNGGSPHFVGRVQRINQHPGHNSHFVGGRSHRVGGEQHVPVVRSRIRCVHGEYFLST
jgi:hypothetical protein